MQAGEPPAADQVVKHVCGLLGNGRRQVREPPCHPPARQPPVVYPTHGSAGGRRGGGGHSGQQQMSAILPSGMHAIHTVLPTRSTRPPSSPPCPPRPAVQLNVKPFMVKNYLWVFVNCLIENPAFDSQASRAALRLQHLPTALLCSAPQLGRPPSQSQRPIQSKSSRSDRADQGHPPFSLPLLCPSLPQLPSQTHSLPPPPHRPRTR